MNEGWWAQAPEFLSTRQVASVFSVDHKTVLRWWREGKLPWNAMVGKGGNRAFLWDKEIVQKAWEEMIREQTTGA